MNHHNGSQAFWEMWVCACLCSVSFFSFVFVCFCVNSKIRSICNGCHGRLCENATDKKMYRKLQVFLLVFLNLTRFPPYWTRYRGVYRLFWWERFRSRIGLEMASNVQPWWTSGSWRRWPLMKMSAASCRLMVPSCICSARMDSTKWALDTAALSGCVARAAYQLCAVILLEFFKSFLQRQKMTWLQKTSKCFIFLKIPSLWKKNLFGATWFFFQLFYSSALKVKIKIIFIIHQINLFCFVWLYLRLVTVSFCLLVCIQFLTGPRVQLHVSNQKPKGEKILAGLCSGE